MTVVRSSFRPAPWLRNPHLQTLWPVCFRRTRVTCRRERLELPDGDFLDLDWGPRRDGPIVVILHGLEDRADRTTPLGSCRASPMRTARAW